MRAFKIKKSKLRTVPGRLFAFLIFNFAFALTVSAQAADFAAIIETFKTQSNFNGAVVVATDGQIEFIGAAGIADRETGGALTPESKFRIASLTKTFTAVVILKLYEQGKIDLHAPLGRYFPEYKGAGRDKVTIHHLMTYSSGIANEGEKEGLSSYKKPIGLDQYIDRYCSGKLEFEPGSKSVYANTEYIILGKIVEKVTGRSFADALQEHILTPLGMESSGMAGSNGHAAGLVKSYTLDKTTKAFAPDEPYYIENYFAAGAMYSTVGDLLKFDTAIFQNRLLQPKTTELMLKTYGQLGNTAYGFWGSGGWGNFSEAFYYRPGGILGSTANWIHTTTKKKTVIVLSNTDATNLFELSEKLYLAATGKN